MKASELRIGNYVVDYKFPNLLSVIEQIHSEYAITSYSDSISIESLSPVPLTVEILQQFGFSNEHYKPNEYGIDVRAGMITNFVLEEKNNEFEFSLQMGRVPLIRVFTHLHDLQNFFFSFWEYDLEIALPQSNGAIATK